jgi:hypothetical protein
VLENPSTDYARVKWLKSMPFKRILADNLSPGLNGSCAPHPRSLLLSWAWKQVDDENMPLWDRADTASVMDLDLNEYHAPSRV